MIYEFITPSDPITFIANDDKVAAAATIILGEGKAGCQNEKGESLHTMVAFTSNPIESTKVVLGEPFEDYINNNQKEIAECFLSFAYGTIESRKSYDDALDAITDEVKLKDFKEKHEDRNRSSMSKWVKAAWNYGIGLMKKHNEKSKVSLPHK